MQAEINYDALHYDVPLLSEHITTHFEKGPIESFTPFFAFQGQLDSNFGYSDYHTFFHVPTTEIGLTGKFRNPKIEYKLLFNFLGFDDLNFFQNILLDDIFIFHLNEHNKAYIGRFRTPVGVEGGVSGYNLPFIYRSQISRNFGGVRGVGTKLMGNYDLIEYNIGATSTERNFRSFLPGVEFTGWANIKPLGKTNGKYGSLKIGSGINVGHKDFDYAVFGTYLQYKYKRFEADFEYAISNGSNGLTGLTENKGQGFYATISYYLTKKLQVLARYDRFNPNRETTDSIATEYTAGLNYFLKGSSLKLIVNYILRQSQAEGTSNRILLGTQILL